MDPARKFTSKLGSRTKTILAKLGFSDQALKIIFLLGLVTFGLSLFLFKFEILSSLSIGEVARLNSVTSLKEFAHNPTDPTHGFLQWLSLKALPNHHIFALRLATAYLLGSALALSAVALYLKFRNRYLPYTFGILALSSPWAILLAHQGYLPGIDTLALTASLFSAYFLITRSDISQKFKQYALLKGAVATGFLAIQPFGPFSFLAVIIIAVRSQKLRSFINTLGKKQKVFLLCPLLFLPLINIPFLLANIDNWKLISGFSIIQDPAQIAYSLLYNIRTIFGVGQTQGLQLGTGRLDFLLIGALALTIYEILKKRTGRLELVAGFVISLIISALYTTPTSIAIVIPFTIAIISLALANMIRIIDAAFPRNPYPRNIARTGMLMLICTITILNIYTFITATVRVNTPETINIVTQNHKK